MDEWITIPQLNKITRKAYALEKVVERCRKLIVRGETCYVSNDLKKAEEYFTKADDALEDVKSDIDCIMDGRYQAQARAKLGLAQCWARGGQWSDAEEMFDEALWTCDECTNGENVTGIPVRPVQGFAK